MVDYNLINGQGFPPNTNVTVSVNAGAKGSETVETDANGSLIDATGWYWIDWWPHGNENRLASRRHGDSGLWRLHHAKWLYRTSRQRPMSAQTASPERHSTGLRRLSAGWCRCRSTQRIGTRNWRRPRRPSTTAAILHSISRRLIWCADNVSCSPSGMPRMEGHTEIGRTGKSIIAFPVSVAWIESRRIQGWDFPPDTDLTIEVKAGDTVKGTDTVKTNASGNFSAAEIMTEYEKGLSAGDSITATYGTRRQSRWLSRMSRPRSTSRPTPSR